jgi:hypothetical protein
MTNHDAGFAEVAQVVLALITIVSQLQTFFHKKGKVVVFDGNSVGSNLKRVHKIYII